MNATSEGGCLCGSVRYRATARPLAMALCHCRSCRRASGAPSVAWTVFPCDAFTIVKGAPTAFSSSEGVVRTFCPTCGTPLTYRADSRSRTIDVTTISLDNPQDFAPTKEIWVDHRVPWEPLDPALPHYAGSSTGASPIGT